MSATWQLRSRAINEVVQAADQFAAWDTLSDRAAEDFGLIVEAEPDENGDPFLVRTSALMFWWGRDGEAEAFIALAIACDLGDTTEVDRRFRREETSS